MARLKRTGTTYFGFEVDDADYKFLVEWSKIEDRSMASLLRRALKTLIAEEKQRRAAESNKQQKTSRGD